MTERPEPRDKTEIAASVANAAVAAFQREAAMRGMPAERLMARCLEMIAADNLFAAVLDS